MECLEQSRQPSSAALNAPANKRAEMRTSNDARASEPTSPRRATRNEQSAILFTRTRDSHVSIALQFSHARAEKNSNEMSIGHLGECARQMEGAAQPAVKIAPTSNSFEAIRRRKCGSLADACTPEK